MDFLRACAGLAVLLAGLWLAEPAAAQAGVPVWTEPANLSRTPQSSAHPDIVADAYGLVHVFWSEDLGGKALQPNELQSHGNGIMYTRWDGEAWTEPIDILFIPDDAVAEYLAAAVDGQNRLHLVWTGQTNFYYSSAPALDAGSARAWSPPLIVASNSARSQWESDIVVDPAGGLHIFYATRDLDPGVFHVASADGAQWGMPSRLSLPLEGVERGFSNVRAIADAAGRLHAVWRTFESQGYGQAAYYARSVDGGVSWSRPSILGLRDPDDFGADYPYLISLSETELHLIYLDGWHRGRSERTSLDAGETWSEPAPILGEMEGVNGYLIPLLDGAGDLHMMVNMRTIDQVSGIFYTRWTKDGWMQCLPVDVAPRNQHYTAAAVRLGNEIHAVYNEITPGEIWHVAGVLPEMTPAAALPTPMPTPRPTETQTAAPRATATATLSRPAAIASPGAPPPATSSSSYFHVILLGIGPALLLAGAVVAVRLSLQRRLR